MKKRHRRFIVSLIVGLLIGVFLHLNHHHPMLAETEDAALDWVIGRSVNTGVSASAPSFVWLDLDEMTYRGWGEPFYTPRDHLVELIRRAASGGAAVIVVDVDLSRPGHDPGADLTLRNFLASYPGECADGHGEKTQCPTVVLARTFRTTDELIEVRTSKLLDVEDIVEVNPYLSWGATLYEKDRDGVVRRWLQSQRACHKYGDDHVPVVVPSVQLVAAAHLQNKGVSATNDYIYQQLEEITPVNACEVNNKVVYERGDKLETDTRAMLSEFQWGDLNLALSEGKIARRVFFHIPWSSTTGITEDGRLLLRPLSAAAFLGSESLAPETMNGRVVIIGASYADSRDIYPTPIGELPGPLIIANSILSLIEYGELEPPPLWAKLIIEALLILIMAVVFTVWDSFFGMLISGVLIITALLPISFKLTSQGVWLDFAVPLIAVQLHQMYAEFEEYRHGRRTEGAKRHAHVDIADGVPVSTCKEGNVDAVRPASSNGDSSKISSQSAMQSAQLSKKNHPGAVTDEEETSRKHSQITDKE